MENESHAKIFINLLCATYKLGDNWLHANLERLTTIGLVMRFDYEFLNVIEWFKHRYRHQASKQGDKISKKSLKTKNRLTFYC